MAAARWFCDAANELGKVLVARGGTFSDTISADALFLLMTGDDQLKLFVLNFCVILSEHLRQMRYN